MKYKESQLGKKYIKEITKKTKNRYCLYVDMVDKHELVLAGVDWQACRGKTKELIENGIDATDIYGDLSDMGTDFNPLTETSSDWGQARKHLWLPEQ